MTDRAKPTMTPLDPSLRPTAAQLALRRGEQVLHVQDNGTTEICTVQHPPTEQDGGVVWVGLVNGRVALASRCYPLPSQVLELPTKGSLRRHQLTPPQQRALLGLARGEIGSGGACWSHQLHRATARVLVRKGLLREWECYRDRPVPIGHNRRSLSLSAAGWSWAAAALQIDLDVSWGAP